MACVAVLAVVALLLLVRLSTWSVAVVVLAVPGVPYVVLLVALAAALAVVARWWPGLVLAGLALIPLVIWTVPAYAADPRAAGARPVLTVVTANLHLGEADPAAIVALARESKAQVLAIQELTPAAMTGLRAAGLDTLLPYRVVNPRFGASGTGLWSTVPIAGGETLQQFTFPATTGIVEVAGVGPVRVASVHPAAPNGAGLATWQRDHDQLATVAAAWTGPVVVAGDFNATRDHTPMRRLAELGYADAGDEAGAGLVRSWPAGRSLPWTPLIGIDHVLIRAGALVGTAVTAYDVPRTDHRALVAVIGGTDAPN